ncbi:Endonuclease exonuclease phosphatase isoform B [Micractinium conductrix]|uniref:Endonuclease exonuclease phosphatase isoform B n=1 Tax=Micractinium conductrix TaxID=554055 RepID=A0A2P6V7H2_9CHLO|nr:Endonuclease exonuclease phosphatase isoform B [Micractinium conductrix]|eukprot:PSC70028.1 Endonuclease exonuclease phosphatase isoform B [Micractinium conductrix]
MPPSGTSGPDGNEDTASTPAKRRRTDGGCAPAAVHPQHGGSQAAAGVHRTASSMQLSTSSGSSNAGPVIFVSPSFHVGMRLAWQQQVQAAGGELVLSAAGAAAGRVTHVVLKQEGGVYDWHALPPSLQPGGSTPAPAYVASKWLLDSSKSRGGGGAWLQVAGYALQPPVPRVQQRQSPPLRQQAAQPARPAWTAPQPPSQHPQQHPQQQQQQQQDRQPAVPEGQQPVAVDEEEGADYDTADDEEDVLATAAAPGSSAAAAELLRSLRRFVELTAGELAELDAFDLVTYNLWYVGVSAAERMAALGQLLGNNGHHRGRYPTFLLFQEMTHLYYSLLQQQPWFRHYGHTPLPPQPLVCFTMIFWRTDMVSDVEVAAPLVYEVTDTRIGGYERSLRSIICQMKEMVRHLQQPDQQGLPYRNDLVGGDVNMVRNPRNPRCTGRRTGLPDPASWLDLWQQVEGYGREKDGWTWDTQIVTQKGKTYGSGLGARLDRIFSNLTQANAQAQWLPTVIARVGDKPIDGVERLLRLPSGRTRPCDVWISDHMGLYACFTRKHA